MKILFVTANLPYPPQQGGALRTYGLLCGLHQAGHDLTLLSFVDENVASIKNTPLTAICSHIETVAAPNRLKSQRLRDLFFSTQPDIARRLYSETFLLCLKQLVQIGSFDIVQFEGIEVACYLPIVRRMRLRAKLVYDAFNAEAAMQYAIYEIDRRRPRRWPAAAYSLVQSRRIGQFEQLLCAQSDLVIAVSPEDAALLQQYDPIRSVVVVANGIFTDDYEKAGKSLDLGEHALTFTGKMDYRPNVDGALWFTEHVLPTIVNTIPNTKFYIVGQKPHPSINHLRQNPAVVITGWVESVLPYLRGTQVYVAPLRMGSGTRLKILEAMAAGCAVVATSLAASGMHKDASTGMLIVDNTEAMAKIIIELFNDSAQRIQLGATAQLYVKTYYDWSVIIPQLLNAYENINHG